jgi:small subunit ribosomal protein S6
MVVVISPDDSEEQLENRTNYISNFISERGGNVDKIDRWGKRKLAYPIKGFIEGFYLLYDFRVQAEIGKQIDANLNITEDVLRHLLVRKED